MKKKKTYKGIGNMMKAIMKKKPTLRALIKKADALASKIVRQRDGRCMLCGKTENLQAHHYIITKGRSTKYRWDLRNLISLDYHCHLFLMHSPQTCMRYTEALKKSAIMNHIVTEEEFEEIKNDMSVTNTTRAFVEAKIEELKKDLENENVD